MVGSGVSCPEPPQNASLGRLAASSIPVPVGANGIAYSRADDHAGSLQGHLMRERMELQAFVRELVFVDPDDGYDSENGDNGKIEWVQDPVLSAYNAHEADRLPRLARVLGAAKAAVSLMSHRYRRLWSGAVIELHDHKGTLLVTWRDVPSRIMFEGVVLGAWEANAEHAHAHTLARS